jgi:hypothetical protein
MLEPVEHQGVFKQCQAALCIHAHLSLGVHVASTDVRIINIVASIHHGLPLGQTVGSNANTAPVHRLPWNGCAKQRSEPSSDKPGAKAYELTLTPLELIDRIAALVPPPRTHRHRYFGVLAPNSPLRCAGRACPAGATQAPSALSVGGADCPHLRGIPAAVPELRGSDAF